MRIPIEHTAQIRWEVYPSSRVSEDLFGEYWVRPVARVGTSATDPVPWSRAAIKLGAPCFAHFMDRGITLFLQFN